MEIVVKLTILAVLIAAAYGVYLGYTKKAVFYMNDSDLFISFSGWVTLVIAGILGMYLQFPILFFIGLAAALGVMLYTVYMAYKYNMKNWYHAIPVGLAKVLLSFVYILKVLNVLFPDGKSVSEKRYNRGEALVIVGVLTPLLYSLINGEDVYVQNGWELPEL